MGFLKADYAFNAAHIETWALIIYWKEKNKQKKPLNKKDVFSFCSDLFECFAK